MPKQGPLRFSHRSRPGPDLERQPRPNTCYNAITNTEKKSPSIIRGSYVRGATFKVYLTLEIGHPGLNRLASSLEACISFVRGRGAPRSIHTRVAMCL